MFQVRKATAKSVQQPREWADPTRVWQSASLDVDLCRYVVHGSAGSWSLDLDCTAKTGPLAGLKIWATFERLEPFETPGRLIARWGASPEAVEGTCSYVRLDSPVNQDGFHIQVYCQECAVESVLRSMVLLKGAASSGVLNIEFSAHDGEKGDFWRTGWKDSELLLMNWRLLCEAPL